MKLPARWRKIKPRIFEEFEAGKSINHIFGEYPSLPFSFIAECYKEWKRDRLDSDTQNELPSGNEKPGTAHDWDADNADKANKTYAKAHDKAKVVSLQVVPESRMSKRERIEHRMWQIFEDEETPAQTLVRIGKLLLSSIESEFRESRSDVSQAISFLQSQGFKVLLDDSANTALAQWMAAYQGTDKDADRHNRGLTPEAANAIRARILGIQEDAADSATLSAEMGTGQIAS